MIDHRAALPPDIISAWFNGDYLIGDRNTNQVKNVGICLALLGTYRYITLEEFEESGTKMFRLAHYGFCRIELVDQELEFHGMRIYTNPQTYTTKGENMPNSLPLWKSSFSKIWDDGIKQNLLFAYSLKVLEADHRAYSRMADAGAKDFRQEIDRVGARSKPQGELEKLVDDLKKIKFNEDCLNQAEKLLSTPEWEAAWLNKGQMNNDILDKKDADNNSDGELFAFLRFEDLAVPRRDSRDLVAQYRSLAPAKIAGFGIFSGTPKS